MKVCIINGSVSYHRMFASVGFQVVYSEDDADFLCFTGGADVHPRYYGEGLHPYSHCDVRRDEQEADIYSKWVGKKPMVGICRGGQFLNVMSGGSMYQDVDNHGLHGTHSAYDVVDKTVVQVTSTHHQMMIAGPNAVVLAFADESTYKEKVGGVGEIVREDSKPSQDVEVVVYPESKVLCFQPHPELYGADTTKAYFFHLLKRELDLYVNQGG